MDGDGRSTWLLYGAYGYTGRLIVGRAVARGMHPTLAGRDQPRTRALAESLGLPWVACGVDDPGALRDAFRGFAAVVNAAGPFSATWRPVLEASMAEG